MCVPAPHQKVIDDKNSQNSASSPGIPASSSVNPSETQTLPAAEYDRLMSPLPPHQCQPTFDHLLQKRDFNAQNGTSILENDAHRHLDDGTDLGRQPASDVVHKLKLFIGTRWGWVVTAATFMTYFNIVGWVGCFSVVFVSLQDEFGRSITETGEDVIANVN